MSRVAISFSAGIRQIRQIEQLVAVDAVIPPSAYRPGKDEACVLVWGRKKSGRLARAFARRYSLPVLTLEDGFIRTCSEDAHSRMTYSLIVDRRGIYYDSDSGSDLEDFLNSDTTFCEAYSSTEEELTQACLELVVDFNITKYNYASDYVAESGDKRPLVLVVDQTRGDASVEYGALDEKAFEQMLQCAINENPGARVVVKTHPDVASGRKRGYLQQAAAKEGVEILADPVNSISLLKYAAKVYVGTSQMGIEALLCGVPVTVFGKAFYAGWGLTDDRVEIPGRSQKRSLRELFFAAYLWYPRYCNPVTGQLWTLPACLEHVIRQKQQFQHNARHYHCVAITPWKRPYLKRFLRSPDGLVSFGNAASLTDSGKTPKCDAVVTWGYRDKALSTFDAAGLQKPLLRLEDGFIRSAGLGSDYNLPGSLVMDGRGLYFNAQSGSDLEYLLNHGHCSEEDLWRSRNLIELILSARVSKYSVGSSKGITFPETASRRLLVVGQVESDASLQFGCGAIKSNALLLQAVRRLNQDAWIAYKPHPDVVAGNRQGQVSESLLSRTVDHVIDDGDIVDCIDATDELHTMTSLAGFEALLRGKSVTAYGTPFYAGWGLTTDKGDVSRREASRTLEELVYFALIAYPIYMDVDTGEYLSPEDMVATKTIQSTTTKNMNWTERQIMKLTNMYRGLRYAS